MYIDACMSYIDTQKINDKKWAPIKSHESSDLSLDLDICEGSLSLAGSIHLPFDWRQAGEDSLEDNQNILP